ncbi:hypothetical protein RRG08_062554 [Elysia crispata]|uniref:Uncharacterized protein n=1 Tax=Elysia crispata TaxID=231223 RepID=A0AAE1E1N6_9GAST|nr:hypothetical protein RRG08_062554 [Elysia crispata]
MSLLLSHTILSLSSTCVCDGAEAPETGEGETKPRRAPSPFRNLQHICHVAAPFIAEFLRMEVTYIEELGVRRDDPRGYNFSILRSNVSGTPAGEWRKHSSSHVGFVSLVYLGR